MGESEKFFVFGALNPITVSKNEMNQMNANLNRFEECLHQLQSKDVYYATPRFFQRQDQTIFGIFFITDEVLSVVPERPSMPFHPDLKVEDYYVRIPENHTIKYQDFYKSVRKIEKYDHDHMVVSLEDDVIEELALHYDVDMMTNQVKEGSTLGRQYDDGRNHLRKIKDDKLPLDELVAYNHLAIYLRWCLEHNLLSEYVLNAIPDLETKEDMRKVIRDEEIFNGCLRSIHFNKAGKNFSRKFYVFNSGMMKGFPHCVDLYAMKYFGKEKYNCEEFHDEAYLFVPFDEAYYQGLSQYIETAWKKIVEGKEE